MIPLVVIVGALVAATAFCAGFAAGLRYAADAISRRIADTLDPTTVELVEAALGLPDRNVPGPVAYLGRSRPHGPGGTWQ